MKKVIFILCLMLSCYVYSQQIQPQGAVDQLNQAVVMLHTENEQLNAQQQQLKEKVDTVGQQNNDLANRLNQTQQLVQQQLLTSQAKSGANNIWVYLPTQRGWMGIGALAIGILMFMFLVLSIKERHNLEHIAKKKLEAEKLNGQPKKVNYSIMAGEDVMTTQLDLARTYIEMENGKHAKSILEIVLKDGNNEHKKTAKELLDQIKEKGLPG